MPYSVGPQNGPHEQEFRSCYFSGTASSGLMVEWRFNVGNLQTSPPMKPATSEEQGWVVEKTRWEPIFTCFAGIAFSPWNDRVIEADKSGLVISSGLCPEIYVETRAVGSLPGTGLLAGSKLVSVPSGAFPGLGVEDGFAFAHNFINFRKNWQQFVPAHHFAISLGKQNSGETGTVRGWVTRH